MAPVGLCQVGHRLLPESIRIRFDGSRQSLEGIASVTACCETENERDKRYRAITRLKCDRAIEALTREQDAHNEAATEDCQRAVIPGATSMFSGSQLTLCQSLRPVTEHRSHTRPNKIIRLVRQSFDT